MAQIKGDWCARPEAGGNGMRTAFEALEAMVNDGWVTASRTLELPTLSLDVIASSALFRMNADTFVESGSVPGQEA